MKKIILILFAICAIGSSIQLSANPQPAIPIGNQPFVEPLAIRKNATNQPFADNTSFDNREIAIMFGPHPQLMYSVDGTSPIDIVD